jgi:hypothetical protein
VARVTAAPLARPRHEVRLAVPRTESRLPSAPPPPAGAEQSAPRTRCERMKPRAGTAAVRASQPRRAPPGRTEGGPGRRASERARRRPARARARSGAALRRAARGVRDSIRAVRAAAPPHRRAASTPPRAPAAVQGVVQPRSRSRLQSPPATIRFQERRGGALSRRRPALQCPEPARPVGAGTVRRPG